MQAYEIGQKITIAFPGGIAHGMKAGSDARLR
jgi:hypothetical protein